MSADIEEVDSHASIASQEAYADRKTTLDPEHRPIITWGKVLGSHRDGGQQPTLRRGYTSWREIDCREYMLACSKGCDMGQVWDDSQGNWVPSESRWMTTSTKGRLTQRFIGAFNQHIIEQQRTERLKQTNKNLPLDRPILIAEVQQVRITVEHWLVYGGHEEFIKRINAHVQEKLDSGELSWGYANQHVRQNHWYRLRKNSKGYVWYGVYEDYNAAVRDIVRDARDQVRKGHTPIIHAEPDEEAIKGVRAPAATVNEGIRSLIDDYKQIPKTKQGNPVVEKKWLDRVNDALTEVELLEQLRDEVQAKLMEGLGLGL